MSSQHARWLSLLFLARVSALRFPAGLLLCDAPTPSIVADLTLLRQRVAPTEQSLIPLMPLIADAESGSGSAEETLADALYLHASVLSADRAGPKPSPQHLAKLDCAASSVDAGCYLALGVNNHLTGGYYWGRCSGPGAAMPAPGVALDTSSDGGVWLVRESNSNDGKRSEWCEFLRAGDQVDLVPGSACAALSRATLLVGVRRDGIPPGAEPRVEALWSRERAGGAWVETACEDG